VSISFMELKLKRISKLVSISAGVVSFIASSIAIYSFAHDQGEQAILGELSSVQDDLVALSALSEKDIDMNNEVQNALKSVTSVLNGFGQQRTIVSGASEIVDLFRVNKGVFQLAQADSTELTDSGILFSYLYPYSVGDGANYSINGEKGAVHTGGELQLPAPVENCRVGVIRAPKTNGPGTFRLRCD
jgi:hypothetical protein